MKKILPYLLTLLLFGCATNTVIKHEFPEIPNELITRCPPLILANENSEKISDFLYVVMKNYEQYQECAIKVDLFIQWYYEQQKIYNNVYE